MLDNARTEGRGTRGVERKSGRVNERDTREQLFKERAGLESGQLTQSRWETVAGEKIPRSVAAELQAMARDFPGRFHHEIVSRADALRAIRLGQSQASQQLELVRVYELDRAQRARERLAKIREIVRAQERAEKFRKVQKFREAAARGRAEAPQLAERSRLARQEAEQARQARQTPETERGRIERETAERVAQEFAMPTQYAQLDAADNGEQAARDAADANSAERAAAEARAAAEKEREAAAKAQDQARNAAFKELDEKGVCPRWKDSCGWDRQPIHKRQCDRHPDMHPASSVAAPAMGMTACAEYPATDNRPCSIGPPCGRSLGFGSHAGLCGSSATPSPPLALVCRSRNFRHIFR
ncbi:hypothetical protein AB4305_34355 [Nocardia sp. 2YAB30]|uniref:hypothetical protein n=1 Tax=Nocardia sp. 2YAB30 TaxID=3233022 RepID=UPI003F9E02AB